MIHRKSHLNPLVFSLAFFSFIQSMEIEKRALFIPRQLGSITVTHDDNGFEIKKGPKSSSVKPWLMDQELRGITRDKLARLIAANAYLSVNKVSKNEYSLRLNGRLRGGGVLGATAGAWLGKALVSVVGHGAIVIVSGAVSLVATPVAGWAVGVALESTLGASIEAASIAGAIAGGIAGGVATGPV